MEREYTDYQYAKYRMLEPPIWGDHYGKALEKFQKSAEEEEPRGAFSVSKVTASSSSRVMGLPKVR